MLAPAVAALVLLSCAPITVGRNARRLALPASRVRRALVCCHGGLVLGPLRGAAPSVGGARARVSLRAMHDPAAPCAAACCSWRRAHARPFARGRRRRSDGAQLSAGRPPRCGPGTRTAAHLPAVPAAASLHR